MSVLAGQGGRGLRDRVTYGGTSPCESSYSRARAGRLSTASARCLGPLVGPFTACRGRPLRSCRRQARARRRRTCRTRRRRSSRTPRDRPRRLAAGRRPARRRPVRSRCRPHLRRPAGRANDEDSVAGRYRVPKLADSRLIELISYFSTIRRIVDVDDSHTLGSHGDVSLGNRDAVPVAAMAQLDMF